MASPARSALPSCAGQPVRRDGRSHPIARPALRGAAQATGFRDRPGAALFNEGSSKDRFIDLFMNRDEKPTEGETTILQALALMNGPFVATATDIEASETLAAVAEAPYLDTRGRLETLYFAALPAGREPASSRNWFLMSSWAAPRATMPRRSATFSGPCSTAPSFALTTE